jgi:hypothetical protein
MTYTDTASKSMQLDASADECTLCRLTGGTNAVVNGVASFAADNIERIGLREMCVQIQKVLATDGVDVTVDDVRVHVQEHISEKRVVMHAILHDLRGLLRTTMRHSVIIDEESQVAAIDHKAAALYLDTVKQVVALYRTT